MSMRALLATICFASMCATATAQSIDRSALLERLVAALPAPEAPSRPNDTQSGAALRSRLLETYPERAGEIDATLSRMSACESLETERVSRRLLTAAANANLTDEEIGALIVFYEGPDYSRLDAIVNRTSSDPPSPQEQEWAQQAMARPELVKFGQIVIHVARMSALSPEMREAIRRCGDTTLTELRAAGLIERSEK